MAACPFCAEEIKDEALACRFCGRDFLFLSFLGERIVKLERRVDGLGSALATARAEGGEARRAAPEARSERRSGFLVAFLLTAIGTIVADVIYMVTQPPIDQIAIAVSYLVPLATGFWAGLAIPGRHVGAYLLVGVAAGVSEQLFLILNSGGEHLSGLAPFVVQVSVPTLLFFAAALWGDWIEGRRQAPRVFSERIARRLLQEPAGGRRESRVRRVAQYIQAIGPILTMLGALGAAYLGYLAQMERPPMRIEKRAPQAPAADRATVVPLPD